MYIIKKIMNWYDENKKYVLVSGTVVLSIVGAGVGFVVYKNNKITFSDWLKIASTEELKELYEKKRLEFCKTGSRPIGMNKIGDELGAREAKEWFKNHPPNLDSNFRWTDANRWDRD